MKNSDFLKILESFPGKEKLKRSDKESLILEYFYIDFVDLSKKIKRSKIKLKLPNNEEIWFKFISFCCIATDFLAMEESEYSISAREILSCTSNKVAERVCKKFNEFFHSSTNVIIDIAGITLEELIEFARMENPLL